MTIEDRRRILFEMWVKTFNSMPAAMFQDERGRYIDDWIQCRWLGFNAALDAVVIELPLMDCIVDEDGFMHDVMRAKDVRAAIESTGLGLKVKS